MADVPNFVKEDASYKGNSSTMVSSSAVITPRGNNFASMTDASGIDALRASAPAFHSNIDRALKVSGKVQVQDSVVEHAKYVTKVQPKEFRTGAPVLNRDGKKLTIIKARAGYTKKTRTPVHRVADRDGNVWLEKETDLTLRV